MPATDQSRMRIGEEPGKRGDETIKSWDHGVLRA